MDYGNYDSSTDARRASDSLRRQRMIAQKKRERRRKLMIRRAIIVTVGVLIVVLAVFVLVKIFGALFNCNGNSQAVQTAAETQAETAEIAETQPAAQASASEFVKPQIPDDGTDGYYSSVNGGIYIYKNMALELFGSSQETSKYYADTISGFKKAAPEYTVYNMVIPNHSEFAIPDRLIKEEKVYVGSQADTIKYIYSNYTEDVKPINCYNALGQHMSEYIYFNTDHHWTGLGAYYAYRAFCEQTGQTPLELSSCTEHKIEGFEGSMVDADPSLSSNLDTVHFWTFPYETRAKRQDNPGEELYDTSVYYLEESGGSVAYGVFIWGDAPLFVEYNDNLKNGKKIAVVKESYGNSFVPYLTNNYEEVHVIDARYFGQNLKSYMQDNDIDEVLFINNIMSAHDPDRQDEISALYN